MQQADIEAVYEELARGIDAAGDAGAQTFLARACLLLARDLADRDRAINLIRQALTAGQRETAASSWEPATRSVQPGYKP